MKDITTKVGTELIYTEHSEHGEVSGACVKCHNWQDFEVLHPDFMKRYKCWQDGELIQNAFTGESADLREFLMTGICPVCWEGLF